MVPQQDLKLLNNSLIINVLNFIKMPWLLSWLH